MLRAKPLRSLRRNRLPILLVLPSLVYLVAFSIFPLFFSAYLSLTEPKQGQNVFIGAGNYVNLLGDTAFHGALLNSFLYTIAAISIEFIFGLLIAQLLTTQVGKGFRDAVNLAIIIPITMTPVVIALMWKILFMHPSFGLFNYGLSLLGIQGQAWLGSGTTAMPSVIFVDIWEWTPFVVLVLASSMSGLPPEQFEAGRIDGASGWQLFRHISLPLLKPAILVILLIRTMDALRVFDTIFMMTKGGPGSSTEVLSILIYLQAFPFFHMGYASAMSYVMMFIIDGISTAFIYILYRGAKGESR